MEKSKSKEKEPDWVFIEEQAQKWLNDTGITEDMFSDDYFFDVFEGGILKTRVVNCQLEGENFKGFDAEHLENYYVPIGEIMFTVVTGVEFSKSMSAKEKAKSLLKLGKEIYQDYCRAVVRALKKYPQNKVLMYLAGRNLIDKAKYGTNGGA